MINQITKDAQKKPFGMRWTYIVLKTIMIMVITMKTKIAHSTVILVTITTMIIQQKLATVNGIRHVCALDQMLTDRGYLVILQLTWLSST